MKTATHANLVCDLINSVDDRDVQDEMLGLNIKYLQILAGLKLAANHLVEIDEEIGVDHSAIMELIKEAIYATEQSEITLLKIVTSW